MDRLLAQNIQIAPVSGILKMKAVKGELDDGAYELLTANKDESEGDL